MTDQNDHFDTASDAIEAIDLLKLVVPFDDVSVEIVRLSNSATPVDRMVGWLALLGATIMASREDE